MNDLGIEHIGGDMFVNVPNADAIFMKVRKLVPNIWFLTFPRCDSGYVMNWSDRYCLKFLNNCYEAPRQREIDGDRIYISGGTRLKPLDKRSSPHGLPHVGSQPQRQRANRDGV